MPLQVFMPSVLTLNRLAVSWLEDRMTQVWASKRCTATSDGQPPPPSNTGGKAARHVAPASSLS